MIHWPVGTTDAVLLHVPCPVCNGKGWYLDDRRDKRSPDGKYPLTDCEPCDMTGTVDPDTAAELRAAMDQ